MSLVADELENMTGHPAEEEEAASARTAAESPVSAQTGADGAPQHRPADDQAADESDDLEPEEAEGPEEPVTSAGAVEELADADADEEIQMDWYILKVQSNRERSIAEALARKMAVEGLDHYFDQAIVPTEKVTEFKGGKKRVVERKLYPGYIVVHMHINEATWFAVRETRGIGDFTGAAGKPTPMLAHEVSRIVRKEEEVTTEEPKLDIKFSQGERVKIKEGNFENFEGEVSAVDEASGRVTVMINIFGRSTPVELEYWHLEAL